MITLAHFIVLGAILFCIAVAGLFINRKNVIVLLMSLELILLAVNTNFVAFSRYLGDVSGQVFVLVVCWQGFSAVSLPGLVRTA